LLQQRNRNHAKNYKAALRAERKLKTIAGRLIREIQRKVSEGRIKEYTKKLDVCAHILRQQKKDSNKIYSLHEPDVYCVSKGKERKSYEFGCKVSILKTQKSGIIVGAMSFATNEYDGHTLEPALTQYKKLFDAEPNEVVADRGYKGKSQINNTKVSIPKPVRAGTSYRETMLIRKKFRRRAGIEPVIGHLKEDCGVGRNYLKGIIGDMVNVLLAAAAYNLRKWMRELKNFLSEFLQSFLSLIAGQELKLGSSWQADFLIMTF
jgi:IS5 family transposase